MMAVMKDVDWVGDVSTIREGWVGARNRAVDAALTEAPDADGIFWVDDDVLIPNQAFVRLIGYEKDFVTGMVFQKFPQHQVLVANWIAPPEKTGMAWWTEYPENVLAKADGCGFGIVYTSTKMLRAIAKDPDFKEGGWFNQFRGDHFGTPNGDPDVDMSEDFSFCMRARAAGFQLYADTGLMCKHAKGPEFIDLEHVEKWKADGITSQQSKIAEFNALNEEDKKWQERS